MPDFPEYTSELRAACAASPDPLRHLDRREDIALIIEPGALRLNKVDPRTVAAFAKADRIIEMLNRAAVTERGSGRTTRQMLAAPRAASDGTAPTVFICPNRGMVEYTAELRNHLGLAGDLHIADPEWLDRESWRGREFWAIVVDHATRLTPRQRSIVEQIDQRAFTVRQRAATVKHRNTWKDTAP